MPGMIISFGKKPIKRFSAESIPLLKKQSGILLRVLENLNHLNTLFPDTGARRINDEHRFVYKVAEDAIHIAQLRYHY